ncbi:MAG TPA: hypothetical protein DCY40_05080 [Actinobacteria bacterium]|nr:hypothetical protein [Actinomycetota bacterium]
MRTTTLIVGLALATLLGVARAEAGGCTVAIVPESGWPGASLTVTGTGFASGADITVSLGDFPVYDGFIDADGGFRIGFRIPDPFVVGEVSLVVADHTDACGVAQPYVVAATPPPQPVEAIAPWGLALLVVAGAVLGVGIAGIAIKRK